MPDVVDAVVGNQVVLGHAPAVAPRPADGYAAVVEVCDFVVRQLAVVRMADPKPDGAGEKPSATRNPAAVDLHEGRKLVRQFRFLPAAVGTDFHPATAEIGKGRILDSAMLTAALEPDSV